MSDVFNTLVILMFICVLGISLANDSITHDSITQILWLFLWAIVLGFFLYQIDKNKKRSC